MKKLLIALLFCIAPLYAEEIAWSANKGGGQIVLTNETCKVGGKVYNKLYRSYMYTGSGLTMNSCYVLEGRTVRMVYEDGSEYRYPVGNFTVKDVKTGELI